MLCSKQEGLVSILVLLDDSLEVDILVASGMIWVSILVLLDDSLEATHHLPLFLAG